METTAVTDILDLFNAESPWGSIKAAPPGPDDEGPWVALEDAASPTVARRLAESYAAVGDGRTEPLTIVGNYTFRELCYIPLLIQGALFATSGLVLALQDNLMVREFEYFQHWRLLEPRTVAPPPGQPAVDTLFAEIRRTYQPLVDSFRAERFVAPANAWGSLLDSLAEGFWQAGARGIGMDNAWVLWQSTIAGRTFPTRRRPRRHQFQAPEAEPEDLSVRAGCCLWYMTAEAKKGPDLQHCYTCYLTPDTERVAWRTAHPRDDEEHEEASA